MKLIVGNYTYSSWSMRPAMYILQHDLPVEIERHCLFTPDMQQTLSAHFSNGKVPLLTDNELDVWDTLSILEYLAEQFPHIAGWPLNPQARAVARSVSAEMHSSFTDMRGQMPMNCKKRFIDYPLSEGTKKDIQRIDAIWQYCRKNYGQDGGWLFGKFSIADAMFAPVVMRFRGFDVELSSVSNAYYDHVCRSEGARKWLALAETESELVVEDEIDAPFEVLSAND